ncbi:hypothetical protein CRG98_006375 [Punica granatum]|uniref:Uncharacterized protein n=1 Tax=Punica granatum TaxID=22663 RepID=A0A2I0KY25_PUNGR|nr:hypothetical protein CRG98_006375 [Punica granatum]
MWDGTVGSRVGPLWLPTLKRPPEVVVVVIWFQSCRVDPYSHAKITENRARPKNRSDWAVFGSDVTTVAPDGILMQGQRVPTPKRPPEVAVVVVWFQSCRVDPYSLTKITKNRARPGNRPRLGSF